MRTNIVQTNAQLDLIVYSRSPRRGAAPSWASPVAHPPEAQRSGAAGWQGLGRGGPQRAASSGLRWPGGQPPPQAPPGRTRSRQHKINY
jgi:hypothetical protein